MYCLKNVWCLLMLMSFLMLVSARPQEIEEDDQPNEANDRSGNSDVGRVQIKVYRGPTKHDGYAPWGYWVKQPSDD